METSDVEYLHVIGNLKAQIAFERALLLEAANILANMVTAIDEDGYDAMQAFLDKLKQADNQANEGE